MQKENGNEKMSFPRNVVGNLPLSESLIKEEKQPCLMKQVEDPRTLRAAKHSGMTKEGVKNRGRTLCLPPENLVSMMLSW